MPRLHYTMSRALFSVAVFLFAATACLAQESRGSITVQDARGLADHHRVSRCETSNMWAIRLLRRNHPIRCGKPMMHQPIRLFRLVRLRSKYRNFSIAPNVFARHWLGGLPSQ